MKRPGDTNDKRLTWFLMKLRLMSGSDLLSLRHAPGRGEGTLCSSTGSQLADTEPWGEIQ